MYATEGACKTCLVTHRIDLSFDAAIKTTILTKMLQLKKEKGGGGEGKKKNQKRI